MNIILLSATEVSLPAMEWFLRNGSLLTLLLPEGPEHPGAAVLRTWARAQGIPCWDVSPASVEQDLRELIEETTPDLLLLFGFPYRVPTSLPEGLGCRAWNVQFVLHAMEGEAGRMKGNITLHEWKGNGERILQQQLVFMRSGEPDPVGRLSDLAVPLLAQALSAAPGPRRSGLAGPGMASIY